MRKIAALALSTHPGPGVAVSAIAVILGIGVGLEWWRVLLLGLAFLANQASVGLSNDWIAGSRTPRGWTAGSGSTSIGQR